MALGYHNNQLCIQSSTTNTPVANVGKGSRGPFYVYDLNDIIERVEHLQQALQKKGRIHFAMKANSNSEILKVLAQTGVGVDAVSGGEIERAMSCGFGGDEIIFSGVGKTEKELQLAIAARIKQINVESPQELLRVAKISGRSKFKTNVGLRMNPDVDPDTHPYIKTGFRENKFGMDESFLEELIEILRAHPNELSLSGLTLHIGSQVRDLSVMREAIRKTKKIFKFLLEEGFELKTFDVGGGLGIDYSEFDREQEFQLITDYGSMLIEELDDLNIEILTEPGRILVARSGVLVSEVQYVKKTPYKTFVILDTGMHHLMRPSLYQAHHEIMPVTKKSERKSILVDVVGPICESADCLGYDRMLPEPQQGEKLAITDVGAYGYVMANHYNSHELPSEYVVKDGQIIKAH